MKALSLFTGIGGLDFAAMANGIEVIAMCEIEPFPVQILQKRFPGVPILPDVRKVDGNAYRGTVDVIFGGFPCQDLSQAGRRAGLVDKDGNVTRSGLWFEMLRIISECRPRFVIGENVRGAINAALDTVTSGLESEGYEVRACLIPASSVGAPHQRERLFVLGVRGDLLNIESLCGVGLADSGTHELQRGEIHSSNGQNWPQPDDEQSGRCGTSGVWRTPDAHADRGAMSEALYQRRVAEGRPININAQVAHYERNWPTVTASGNERTGSTQYREGSMHSANLGQIDDLAERKEGNNAKGQLNPAWVEQLMGYPDGWTDPDCDAPTPWMGWPARPGEAQHEWEHPRTIVGLPHRAKRLKALGNSVVPQQAEPFFRAIAIMDELTKETGAAPKRKIAHTRQKRGKFARSCF